jgi:hypothetical protein
MRHYKNFMLVMVALLTLLSTLSCGKKESPSVAAVTAQVHPASPLFVYRQGRVGYSYSTTSGVTTYQISPNSVDFGFSISNESDYTLVVAALVLVFEGTYKSAPVKSAELSVDYASFCAPYVSGITDPARQRAYYAVIAAKTSFIGYAPNSTSCVNLITSGSPEIYTMSSLPKIDDGTRYNVKVKLSGWFSTVNSSGQLSNPVENFSKSFTFATQQ